MCLFSVDIWERSSTGLFASKRDRVLNGHTDHYYGNHYSIIGLGTSA